MTIWTFLPGEGALALTMMFVAFGLAAWANGLFFIGYGAEPAEGGAHPVKTVGVISFIAGLARLRRRVIWVGFVVGGPGIAVDGPGDRVRAVLHRPRPHGVARPRPEADRQHLHRRSRSGRCRSSASPGSTRTSGCSPSWSCGPSPSALIWAVVYGKVKANWLGWWLILTAIWTFFLPALRIATGSTWLIMS